MNRNKFLWTFRYSLINVTYFAAFCTVHAYAAVYLLANGFTNTQVGILLALANIISAVFQPVIAGVIDKPGPLTNRRFILFSVVMILAGSVALLFFHQNKFFIFIVYALIYLIQFSYQPVVLALCFESRLSNLFWTCPWTWFCKLCCDFCIRGRLCCKERSKCSALCKHCFYDSFCSDCFYV